MFIPLKDINPTRNRAYITVLLIIANCLVFFYQAYFSEVYRERDVFYDVMPVGGWSSSLQYYVYSYGLVPAEIASLRSQTIPVEDEQRRFVVPFTRRVNPLFTLFSSMFMHGSLLHLLGNMLFLWIFGNNIEDRLGPIRFLIFYLLAGIAAALAHVLFNLNSLVPVIGASGAVSGVMGAYLVLFPQARIITLVFLFIFVTTIEVPAFFFLLFWFLMQFYYVGSSSGIAWLAHVGGFIAGIFLLRLFDRRRQIKIFY